MRQADDRYTLDLIDKPKRGRPRKPDAKNDAQRSREYRARQRAQREIAKLEAKIKALGGIRGAPVAQGLQGPQIDRSGRQHAPGCDYVRVEAGGGWPFPCRCFDPNRT